MIEELRRQRDEYVAELEALKQTDLEAIRNARFELVKETIAQEVEAEFNEKLAGAEQNVAHYDFVIARVEAAAAAEINEENIVEE